ncbi:protein of unknown function (plasmid) [Caballeronia sp. S22]
MNDYQRNEAIQSQSMPSEATCTALGGHSVRGRGPAAVQHIRQ